jgi:hypothetical protein
MSARTGKAGIISVGGSAMSVVSMAVTYRALLTRMSCTGSPPKLPVCVPLTSACLVATRPFMSDGRASDPEWTAWNGWQAIVGGASQAVVGERLATALRRLQGALGAYV